MSKKNQLTKIEYLLTSGLFYNQFNNVDIIIDKLKEKIDKGETLRLLYGETYDTFGCTIDSLKYYFMLNALHNLLEETGLKVESQVLIGDTASTRNQNVADKDYILSLANQRLQLVNQTAKLFNLKIASVLMSDIITTSKFKSILGNVVKKTRDNLEVQGLFRKTILENRVKQEQEMGYLYACEEIALILDFDLKLGPPREFYYDSAAQIIASDLGLAQLLGLYLKPSYPLGMNFDYYINNPEIEKFGLTPYKAGSNRLHKNRVILGETTLENLDRLIKNTFMPSDSTLPNPIQDLVIILDLANRSVNNDYEFLQYETINFAKKDLAKKVYSEILNKYENEN